MSEENSIMFNSKAQLNNKLTCVSTFDANKVVFSEPIIGTVGEVSDKQIKYRRIRYGIKNNDGTISDLIIRPSRLYSFGIQENRDLATGALSGYSVALCMWNREGATEFEMKVIDVINAITEKTKQFLIEHKDDIEQFELEMSDLKKLNPLYYKKDKGVIVDNVCPKLYAKLLYSKKNDAILTKFYTPLRTEIKSSELMEKHMYIEPAIKIESIFVGSKITIQVKIIEAIVEFVDSAKKSLLFEEEENNYED